MANRSCVSAVTLPEFARRQPSGILSAAVFDRSASVSSGFPPWQTLGMSHPLSAISLWPRPHRLAYIEHGGVLCSIRMARYGIKKV